MINRVVAVGRLVKDPVLRRTNDGTAVVSFTIAVDDKFDRERTNFFDCVAWQKTAEFVAEYVKKGHLVGVDGRLQHRTYETKEGFKTSVVEIVAESVQSYQPKDKAPQAPKEPEAVFENISEDDLPF